MTVAMVSGDNPLKLHAVFCIVKGMGWQVAAGESALSATIKIIAAADAASAIRLIDKMALAPASVPLVVILDVVSSSDSGLAGVASLHGVISSDQSEEVIASVLRLVSNGHKIISRDLKAVTATTSGAIRMGKGLTPRESEIAREVTRGRSNKEIGRVLGISPNTVEVHVSSLIRKLGVRNRTQVATAVRV